MIHLILGGARSGKSRFAEQQASHSGQSVLYIATATAGDAEMRSRIEHHQRQRPQDWQLVEEPFNLSQVIAQHNDNEKTLIIECMTLWVNNWLCTNDLDNWETEKQAFIDALIESSSNIIIVSNEVGSGVVPLGELSRDFVDQAGWLNQALAGLADKSTLVVAGCPLQLKPAIHGGPKGNSNAD